MGKRRAALPSALLDLKRMAELPGRGLSDTPAPPEGLPGAGLASGHRCVSAEWPGTLLFRKSCS